MRGFRSKLILLLIVYFAGFATAIYCLAPAPENYASDTGERDLVHSALKSDEFAKSFNDDMHKCIDFTKDTAQRVGSFIKQKLEERKTDS